jgi:outer membrane protein assembly factor BamB
LVGGEDVVAAYSADDGRRLWSHAVDGKAHALAVAQGRLLVSTDTGSVYAFQTGQTPSEPVPSPAEVVARDQSRTANIPAAETSPASHAPLRLAAGPWLQFIEPGHAIVRWHTSQPSPSVLRYWLTGAEAKTPVKDDRPKTEHQVSLHDLKQNRVYQYVIEQPMDGQVTTTQPYACDTLFDYSVARAASVPSPFAPNNRRLDYRQVARRILSETDAGHGICVILGSGDGHLAYELARQSRLRIIAVDTDRDNVEAARAALRRAQLYGGRVAVHHVQDYDHPNIPHESANLVVSQQLMSSGHLPGQAGNVVRLLKPGHGVAYLGQPADVDSGLSKSQLVAWFQDAGVQPRWAGDDRGFWAAVRREPLPGAGQWTHLYGRADNSAFGGEELAGVRKADQLAVQWFGRPGPRYQADRNGRKPSPLAVNGRLFLQGENRIIGMDTMNGTILWSLEVPDFHRFNMPRDCSNWCADEENLYAVMRDKCWRVSAKTGNVEQFYDVLSPDNRPFDWGYVSAQDNLLLGSAVSEGASWTGFHGGEGWYDAKSGPQTAKICSDSLFALDKQTGQVQWQRSDGLVINCTITIGSGRVYFVQSRDPTLKALPSRRVESPLLWKGLVLTALDVNTGQLVWEQPIQPVPGIVTFYLAHSDQTLVLSSSTDNQYHTYAFDDDTGKARWQTSLPWEKDNHGGHMSRPAIVDGKVYVRPHVMSLADGQVLPEKVPGGGCGTYACTSEALFFRAGTVTVWDRDQHSSSTWKRLRPDCWLSTIPADGLLLSPEGGGGCSCGIWMETSVAFKPIASLFSTAPATARNSEAP